MNSLKIPSAVTPVNVNEKRISQDLAYTPDMSTKNNTNSEKSFKEDSQNIVMLD